MSGMIGVGRGIKDQGRAGLAQAARAETQRNITNEQIEMAEEADKKATIGTAGGLALSYGLSSAAGAGAGAAAAGGAAAGTAAATTGAMGVAAGGGAATTGALAAMGPVGWAGLGLLAISLL